MAAIVWTRLALLQRIRKHISNTLFASDDYQVSDNELILYIDQSAAARMVGQMYANAKIEGAMVVPEAYLITYSFATLTKDPVTGYWTTDLPQPPMSLPLGYNITQAYFAKNSYGKGQNGYPIKNKRVAYRQMLPKPSGFSYWIENNQIWVQANDNSSLLNQPFYVQMPSARTTDENAVMNMPEDDVEAVFDDVIKHLMQRYGFPHPPVQDSIPQGTKA